MNIAADKEMLTSTEVARILLVTPGHVRELCKSGAFPNAHRPGKWWLIPRSDLNDYIIRRETER